MDDNQPKAKYLVLNHAISASFKERLLGCVVNDVTDPANGLQPDFAIPERDNSPGFEGLKSTMTRYLMENETPNTQGEVKFKNQVNLRDLQTERIVEGDVSVEGSLTKLLSAHYGHKDKRNFEIEAATGKRYHLHNAIYRFKDELWSNKYYRDRIQKVIDQKRDDNTLETLDRAHRRYGTKRSRHKCEVIILPMVVGILTCEEIKVNVLDNTEKQKGATVEVPVDKAVGLQTNGMLNVGGGVDTSKVNSGRTAETIPDEVIVAIAYDLIAISTGKHESSDPSHAKSQGTFLTRWFSRGTSPAPCPACEENKLAYPAAWRHDAIRTNSSRGMNPYMGVSNPSGSDYNPSTPHSETDLSDPEDAPDLAHAPIELYVAQPEHYVLAEDLFPGVSPSSTGSTIRSKESRTGGKTTIDGLVDSTKELHIVHETDADDTTERGRAR